MIFGRQVKHLLERDKRHNKYQRQWVYICFMVPQHAGWIRRRLWGKQKQLKSCWWGSVFVKLTPLAGFKGQLSNTMNDECCAPGLKPPLPRPQKLFNNIFNSLTKTQTALSANALLALAKYAQVIALSLTGCNSSTYFLAVCFEIRITSFPFV